MARRIVAALVFLAWVVLLAAVVYRLQDKEIAKLQYQRPYRDTLNLPLMIDSDGNEVGDPDLPKMAKVMALGYDQMVASVLWLRVIQAYGAKLQHVRENPRELHAMENLFWVVSELDPHFVDAYTFGALILGEEGRKPDAALRLLDRGIARSQNQTYKIAYDAVFLCLSNLEDYDLARFYVRQALKAPDCPDYVRRLEQHIDMKKGNYELALERWLRESLQAYADHQTYLHDIARSQIENVINEWHTSGILEAAMDRYFERHQDYPARLEQLEEEGMIGKVRQVDGQRFMALLDGAKVNQIPIEQAVDLIMGTKDRPGTIIESDRLPRDTHGEPYLLVDRARIPVQEKPRAVERQKVRKRTELELFAIRRRLEGYRKLHGRYPERLADLPEMQPGAIEQLPRKDPAGMSWKYNPETGEVGSYVFPELDPTTEKPGTN